MNMKLSIITINFNNLEGLKKTAESVINQTWKEFEWIIIDGGSTDGSKEYIVKLNDDLTRNGWNPIAYWCSEPDKGIYNAMNKGIVKAHGEYLNFMNSGDCFYENRTLDEFMKKANLSADIIYGDWVFVHSDYESICKYNENFDIYDLYMRNICHQAMFIKSVHLHNEGFNEKYKIVADYAKWMSFALKGRTFERVDSIICKHDMFGISYQMQDLFNQERQEMLNNIVPKLTLKLLKKHELIEKNEIYSRVSCIEKNGGLTLKILKSILEIVDMIALFKRKIHR